MNLPCLKKRWNTKYTVI
ncbi:PEP-utilizing enzyme, conserved domain family protein, partial [Chlamydia psittaci 84-8471/1]